MILAAMALLVLCYAWYRLRRAQRERDEMRVRKAVVEALERIQHRKQRRMQNG